MLSASPAGFPNAWEHALPFRVLVQELQARGKKVPDKVEDLLKAWEQAEDDLKTARNRSLTGDPDADRAILKDYDTALARCAAAEKPLKRVLHDADLTALCFSGGGIRSASFGLGVLTQLARYSGRPKSDDTQQGVVSSLDYVSTVSGGGYLGSWFTGWIKRHPRGLDGVIDDLASPPPTSLDPEPPPVRHLRDYTRYLAPRTGVLSADSWTLAAIVLRNLLLNWAILVPAMAAVLLLPVLNSNLFYRVSVTGAGHWEWLAGAVLSALGALFYISWKLPGNYEVQPDHSRFVWPGFLLLGSAWCLAGFYITDPTKLDDKFAVLFVLALIAHAGLIIGRIVAGVYRGGRRRLLHFYRNLLWQALVSIVSSLVVAGLLWFLGTHAAIALLYEDPEGLRLYVSLAVPLIWVAFMLAVALLNGLSAHFEADEDREWWSRAGAYVMRGTLLWAVAHLLVLYAPDIVQALNAQVWGTSLPGGSVAAALAAAIGAIASRAGFSKSTPSGTSSLDLSKLGAVRKFLAKRELLIPVLGGLFFLLLAVVLADANTFVGPWVADLLKRKCNLDLVPALAGLGFFVAITLVLSPFINANTFSLHAMYRARLIRAYLGASNAARKANPFTNFDPADNFPMHSAPCSAGAPLHVANMCLNLVAGRKLAWQQRKAESFTVSALHAGSFRVGYRPTKEYAGKHAPITISIGTAMAISGAAATPNMGYHSSPVLTLAMTFFNARLGWWLPNPGPRGSRVWRQKGPRFSLWPLINEGLGQTSDRHRWVYVSDGGHFENLGVYEMVLRRCKRIIVVDGSADPSSNLDDLAGAIRKAQIDLGIPIQFKHPAAFQARPEFSNRHCFVATIRYSDVDGTPEKENGRLVYIKASLTGDEPEDVMQYARTHPDFPHESTANQFFNESQFQSYMHLGEHIVEKIVKDRFGERKPKPLTTGDFFDAAAKHVEQKKKKG